LKVSWRRRVKSCGCWRWAAIKAGQSSELVKICTIFKPGFGWCCQTVWIERPRAFLLCADLSANYMIFIGKFLKLMTLVQYQRLTGNSSPNSSDSIACTNWDQDFPRRTGCSPCPRRAHHYWQPRASKPPREFAWVFRRVLPSGEDHPAAQLSSSSGRIRPCLCSRTITVPSSLLRMTPPLYCASVLKFSAGSLVESLPWHRNDRFPCSVPVPE
jgi:hypothetical protein